MKKEKYIGLKEASKLLGVNKQTLRNWDRTGKLKTERHPLNNFRIYLRSEIDKLKLMEKTTRKLRKGKMSHARAVRKRVSHKHVQLGKAKPVSVKSISVVATNPIKPVLALKPKGEFLSIEEACLFLGITPQILVGWCDAERIVFEINPETGQRMFNKRKLVKTLKGAR